METQPNAILVSDFDGTMTAHDFYDLVCQDFPDVLDDGHWQQYEAGKITHFEALRRIFAAIRASQSEIVDIIQRMQIDPAISQSVEQLRHGGWDVVVASAGCDWYIKRILAEAGVEVLVHANPGEFSEGQGLIMTLPVHSPFLSADLGINKVAVVKDALKKSSRVAFAGDGRPDLPAALLVQPQYRFARKWLATRLSEIGEPFHFFETWSDVAEGLLQESDHAE